MSRIESSFAYSTNEAQVARIPLEVSNDRAETVHRESVPLEPTVLARQFDAGIYLVRATLPSGEMIGQTVTVRPDSMAQVVLRPRRQSPRESLGWAFYLQRPAAEAPAAVATSENVADLPRIRFWHHDASGWTEMIQPPRSTKLGRSTDVFFDPYVRFQPGGARLLIEIRSGSDWRRWELGQFWVHVTFKDVSRFVAVPPAHDLRILVVDAVPQGKDDAPFRVLVGSGDPRVQALLAFLTSGDFASARQVGEDWYASARALLESRLDDPGAATVAAYMLLGSADAGLLDMWTSRLATGAPWLPDAAVIRASHLLAHADPNAVDVSHWLREAVRRGIPLYSRGLRLAYDGLVALEDHFAGELAATRDDGSIRRLKDELGGVRSALATIRPYTAAALWESPFTCFGGDHPDEPHLAGVPLRASGGLTRRETPTGVPREGAELTWENVKASMDALAASLNAFDWARCGALCDDLIEQLDAGRKVVSARDGARILGMLRRKRRFVLMERVATALLRAGLTEPIMRRQYAQSLIEQGKFAQAGEVLNGMLDDEKVGTPERTEAAGLLGRVYKQMYVSADGSGNPELRDRLRRSIHLYYDTYRLEPEQNLWHGINTVALLARAERDGVAVDGLPSARTIAAEISAVLRRAEFLWAWDRATAVEVAVALGDWPAAYDHVLHYVADATVDAFECASMLRQLTEVWQLTFDREPGSILLPTLQAALLSREGGQVRIPETQIDGTVGLAKTGTATFDALFGQERYQPLRWFQDGLAQCSAVGRVLVRDAPVGVGCLVKEANLVPETGGNAVWLLTVAHILASSRPDDVNVVLASDTGHAAGKFADEIWTSAALDITCARLSGGQGLPTLRFDAPWRELPAARFDRVCVVSIGADSTLGLQECAWIGATDGILRYRTPGTPPPPGSPVFDAQTWSLIGIHRAEIDGVCEAATLEAFRRAARDGAIERRK